MGTYLNPGNSGFERILNGHYVDKTGMISLINDVIDTTGSLICVSRPRRFGKSYAAQMLSAYYDCSCDSSGMFDGLDIATSKNYKKYLNRYNVIYLDITSFLSDIKSENKSLSDVTVNIKDAIRNEVDLLFPDIKDDSKLSAILLDLVERSGKKIVFIIDEWDAVIREAKNDDKIQSAYLNLLRDLFKNGNFTAKAVAAAYMTGILPIKKDGTESAISDFDEYSILSPKQFTAFTGFTELEVQKLCDDNAMNLDSFKEWYDGYHFDEDESIYNPYSVMNAVKKKSFESYWQKTSAAESLPTYIDMDFEGLQADIVRLIAGEELEVSVNRFSNDFESFKSKDDVLTLLIHLGYLAYDKESGTVRIPNKEIRCEFEELLKNADKPKLAALIKASGQLLKDTIDGNEEAVASAIESIRQAGYAPAYYNDEQALRYVIKFAYIVCVDKYLRFEELPSGKGVADIAFLPKRINPLPALIIELKWNRTSEAAISQVKDKNYPKIFEDYGGEIKLVGINYDEKMKKHTCKIETFVK